VNKEKEVVYPTLNKNKTSNRKRLKALVIHPPCKDYSLTDIIQIARAEIRKFLGVKNQVRILDMWYSRFNCFVVLFEAPGVGAKSKNKK